MTDRLKFYSEKHLKSYFKYIYIFPFSLLISSLKYFFFTFFVSKCYCFLLIFCVIKFQFILEYFFVLISLFFIYRGTRSSVFRAKLHHTLLHHFFPYTIKVSCRAIWLDDAKKRTAVFSCQYVLTHPPIKTDSHHKIIFCCYFLLFKCTQTSRKLWNFYVDFEGKFKFVNILEIC